MQFKLIALAAFFSATIAAPSPATDNANQVEARRAAVLAGDAPTTQCEGAGNACSGVASYWDSELGACGWYVNTESDMQIALPYGLMGDRSNDNPYCGRSVTINANGRTVQATVADKCMGCEGYKIDLTKAVFRQLEPNLDVGIIQGVTWYFN